MGEISAASQEQTAGIDQINQAVAQMDQVTQQNAALVEEASAASEAMQDQAAKLALVVSVFKLDAVAAPRPALRPVAAVARSVKPARMAAVSKPRAAVGEQWEQF